MPLHFSIPMLILWHWCTESHTHTPPPKKKAFIILLRELEVSYILEENFMMKYGPYEKYISICSLSFLCSGWNSALKLNLCRINVPFTCLAMLVAWKSHFAMGGQELTVVESVSFLGFLWQWDKYWNCLCLSQWDFYPWHQRSKDLVVWFLVRKFFILFGKFQLLALSVCRVWSLLEIYEQFPMGGFLMLILQLRRQGTLDAAVSERTDLK